MCASDWRVEGHSQMPALTSQFEAGYVIVGAWPQHPYAAATSTAWRTLGKIFLAANCLFDLQKVHGHSKYTDRGDWVICLIWLLPWGERKTKHWPLATPSPASSAWMMIFPHRWSTVAPACVGPTFQRIVALKPSSLPSWATTAWLWAWDRRTPRWVMGPRVRGNSTLNSPSRRRSSITL